MKKIIILLSLVLFVTGLAAAQSKSAKVLYVQIKTLTLKTNSGSFGGDNKGTLKYGDSVTVLQVDGKYTEVQSVENEKISGWTPTANLTTKKIVAGSSTTTASVKEVALAGKGFSQEAEKSMKAQKPTLNYAEVDKTEKIVVHEKAIKKFLEDGQLKMGDTAGDKK